LLTIDLTFSSILESIILTPILYPIY